MSSAARRGAGCALAIAGIIASTAALAEMTEDEWRAKACIFMAADKLPQIPGLRIIRSSAQATAANPAEQEKRGDTLTKHYAVSLDIEAAAQQATFKFDCASGPDGTTARSLGMSR